MKRASRAFQINKRLAEHSWGRLSSRLVTSLRSLTSDYSISVGRGDIICLDEHWYITHSGLLRLASRRRCVGIEVEMVRDFCDPTGARWAFRATAFPSDKSAGFVGYGDADPTNVSSLVRGAEMRDGRDPSRQSRPAQGLRHRHLLSRGDWNESESGQRSVLRKARMGTGIALAPRSATVCARSSASTSSTPNWSKPTPLTSAAPRHSERPAERRLRTSSSNWQTGPRRTAMPCSANSTATCNRSRRWSRETSSPRPRRSGPRFSSRDS